MELWLNCKNVSTSQNNMISEEAVIWNNVNILYNDKTLYFKHWIKNGFIKISSLFNKDGTKKTFEALSNKIKKPGGIMLEYLALFSAIPKQWDLSKVKKQKYISNDIQYGQVLYPMENCTAKIIRSSKTSMLSVKPICQLFWEKKFPNYDFDWEQIWGYMPLIIKEARLVSLNWKILSNIYPTNILLSKMGKAPDNNCQICDTPDFLEHFFFYCKLNKKIMG